MPVAVPRAARVDESFGEKEFYLDEFRAHTLCLAVPLADCERAGGFETLARVARDLVVNETRLMVLLGVPEPPQEAEPRIRRLRGRLQRHILTEETRRLFPVLRGRHSLAESVVDLTGVSPADDLVPQLELVWKTLRRQPLFFAIVAQSALVELAQRLGGRLRVHKLVFVESRGGISSPGKETLSFLDDTMLTAVLRTGQAEWSGLAERRDVLGAVQSALRGGVHSVNLCALEGLERELYTYEGSGTLFTLEDYCRVDRLGIDDFEEVERLIARGQREGFLKPRNGGETLRLLLNGYGATIGAHHLAGVCGLETESYADDGAAEIVGLYTITRFKGEGVGRRLIDRVLVDAREAGFAYVFACTTEPRAGSFFERHGFRSVGQDDVPQRKWAAYDEARRSRVKVYRRDL